MKFMVYHTKRYRVLSFTSQRKAIKKHCEKTCIFSDSGPVYCPLEDCPLHSYQFGRGKQNPKERAKAIGDFCFKWCKKDITTDSVVYCKRPYCALYPHRLARNSNEIHREIPLLHGDQKLRKRLMIKYINDFYGKFMW